MKLVNIGFGNNSRTVNTYLMRRVFLRFIIRQCIGSAAGIGHGDHNRIFRSYVGKIDFFPGIICSCRKSGYREHGENHEHRQNSRKKSACFAVFHFSFFLPFR